jgi:hypothetical protein
LESTFQHLCHCRPMGWGKGLQKTAATTPEHGNCLSLSLSLSLSCSRQAEISSVSVNRNGGGNCRVVTTRTPTLIYTGKQFTVRPPLWSSGQSPWLQIQRSGFDSWEVVDLELSLVRITEELLGRKSSGSGLENR